MDSENNNSSYNDLLWGIDLGGTKIEGVVLNSSASREILFRDRIPTEAEQGYKHVLHQIDKLVNRMEDEVGRRSLRIGIGTPGIINPETGKLKNSSNAVCLNDKPLKSDLEDRLRMKVEMANDGHCFVLAESRHGVVNQQYPEASVIFGAIIGTGVGGGIVVNDQLLYGRHGISGEWGHNFLDESGYECFCGIKGCVEKVISGTALEMFYAEQSGIELELSEIYRRSKEENDSHAEETINRLIHYFGKAVGMIVNILDPDALVIGGGVSNIDEIFSKGRSEIRSHIFNENFDTPVLKPMLGDTAGVIGAAYLNSS